MLKVVLVKRKAETPRSHQCQALKSDTANMHYILDAFLA